MWIGLNAASSLFGTGQRVEFTTTSGLPSNFSTGTTYYVVSVGASSFSVSATLGGQAISAGSAGSGTQKVKLVSA
jgi:hypothetical protein